MHLDASQDNSLSVKVNASSHGVDNRLGLLKDFLLHEGGEVALHDLLDLHLEGCDFTGMCIIQRAFETMDLQNTFCVYTGYVVILNTKN